MMRSINYKHYLFLIAIALIAAFLSYYEIYYNAFISTHINWIRKGLFNLLRKSWIYNAYSYYLTLITIVFIEKLFTIALIFLISLFIGLSANKLYKGLKYKYISMIFILIYYILQSVQFQGHPLFLYYFYLLEMHEHIKPIGHIIFALSFDIIANIILIILSLISFYYGLVVAAKAINIIKYYRYGYKSDQN